MIEVEEFLTPAEAAAMCKVDTKTLVRWANTGRISPVRTPGGHRRYRKAEIEAIMRTDARTRRRLASADDPEARAEMTAINGLISGTYRG